LLCVLCYNDDAHERDCERELAGGGTEQLGEHQSRQRDKKAKKKKHKHGAGARSRAPFFFKKTRGAESGCEAARP
jgi:hypothetical protein